MVLYTHEDKEIDVPEGDTPPEGAVLVVEQDTSNFNEQMTKEFIGKLKDENAKRRIANKKLTETIDTQKSELGDLKKKVEEITGTLKGYKDKEEELSMKDASELEKLQKKITTLEESLRESKQALKDATSKEQLTAKQVLVQGREIMIDRLVSSLGFTFSSDYEREGMINTLTKLGASGEFEKSNEEVIYEVKQFLKDRGTPPNVPGPGPGNRQTETPLVKEIEALLAKRTLSTEEQARLVELTDIVEKELG